MRSNQERVALALRRWERAGAEVYKAEDSLVRAVRLLAEERSAGEPSGFLGLTVGELLQSVEDDPRGFWA